MSSSSVKIPSSGVVSRVASRCLREAGSLEWIFVNVEVVVVVLTNEESNEEELEADDDDIVDEFAVENDDDASFFSWACLAIAMS